MSILDFREKSAEADAKLASFKCRADGKDEHAYVYECDVVFTIANPREAEVAAHVLPGAVEVFTRAQEQDTNWKGRVAVVPDLSGVKVDIAHAARGKVAISGTAEVKQVELRASKKAVTVRARFVFGGQTAAQAANLAEALREAVHVALEQQQQPLPLRFGGAAPSAGQLVVASMEDGTVVVGRMIAAEDDGEDEGILKLEDFSNTYDVEPGEVVSTLTLGNPPDDLTSLLRSYRDRCKRRAIEPTWEALVLALGEGAPPATGRVEITSECVERAVELIKEGKATMELPPEKGGGTDAATAQA